MRLQLRGVLLGALMLPSVSYSSTDMVEFLPLCFVCGFVCGSQVLFFVL